MELSYRLIETRGGFLAYVASSRGLRRLYLPEARRTAVLRHVRAQFPELAEDPELLPKLARDLQRFFEGVPVDFNLRLDCPGHSTFEEDVWHACRGIAYGETRSYKDLAELVGRPGGARAIGMAMSRNPVPIVVPCHRVIKSDGSPGGFSSPGGVDQKCALLEMEAAHV